VHSYLDAHHKLGLDEEWANDVSRGDGLMPDYESLAGVYQRLGWNVLQNGRVIAPDPEQIVRRRKKSRERRQRPGSASTGLPRSVSAASSTACGSSTMGGYYAKLAAPPSEQSLSANRWVGNTVVAGKKRSLPKPRQEAQVANPGCSASHRASSAPAVRTRPLRPGQQDAPIEAVRGARHLRRPSTAIAQAALRRCGSAPGLNTAKRSMERRASSTCG